MNLKYGQPLITVCVLNYNGGDLARLAIKSVLACNFQNLELICLDDASTDGSASTLELLSTELGFDFYAGEKNRGIAHAYNKGLRLASGKYFMLLGDDLVLPNRIQGDVDALERHPSAGLVCGKVRTIDEKGKFHSGASGWSNSPGAGLVYEIPEEIFLGNSKVFAPTATYRTQTVRSLGGWPENSFYVDKPMFLRFAKEGVPIFVRSEVTTLYRRHSKNYSAKFREDHFRHDMKLVDAFELEIPKWKLRLKFLFESHYWMLYLNADGNAVRRALEAVDSKVLAMTTRSYVFRLLFLVASFAIRKNYLTRNIASYLKR